MKRYLLTILYVFIAVLSVSAQNVKQTPNMGGGEYMFRNSECISDNQREAIKAMLKANVEKLTSEGKLKTGNESKVSHPKFKWPLKQMPAYDFNYYYGISNFIDHDASYPNHVLDYNCGNRTYDNASGYNHQGTDIFLWPFSWLQMQRKQVKIVAAAPGIIIGKSDGNFDMSCGFNNNNWNAVYIQHADGSVAWYGHMKNHSLTSKLVGESVEEGEKLGYVGSSGNSTGPHLHFEVYNSNNQLIDPWKGSCNNITTSWWAKQKPYYESKLNTILTQSGAPVFPTCPGTETTNESDHFKPGNAVYFAAYYHDQLAGQSASYKITRPDKSIFAQWTYAPSDYYEASYWYWWYTLPANAPLGKWKFQVIFQGDTLTRTFTVASTFALNNAVAASKNNYEFTLSPNPALNNLNVEIKNKQALVSYSIYDINGKLCREGSFNDVENNISIAALQKGVYYLKVTDEQGIVLSSKKFVKQ